MGDARVGASELESAACVLLQAEKERIIGGQALDNRIFWHLLAWHGMGWQGTTVSQRDRDTETKTARSRAAGVVIEFFRWPSHFAGKMAAPAPAAAAPAAAGAPAPAAAPAAADVALVPHAGPRGWDVVRVQRALLRPPVPTVPEKPVDMVAVQRLVQASKFWDPQARVEHIMMFQTKGNFWLAFLEAEKQEAKRVQREQHRQIAHVEASIAAADRIENSLRMKKRRRSLEVRNYAEEQEREDRPPPAGPQAPAPAAAAPAPAPAAPAAPAAAAAAAAAPAAPAAAEAA